MGPRVKASGPSPGYPPLTTKEKHPCFSPWASRRYSDSVSSHMILRTRQVWSSLMKLAVLKPRRARGYSDSWVPEVLESEPRTCSFNRRLRRGQCRRLTKGPRAELVLSPHSARLGQGHGALGPSAAPTSMGPSPPQRPQGRGAGGRVRDALFFGLGDGLRSDGGGAEEGSEGTSPSLCPRQAAHQRGTRGGGRERKKRLGGLGPHLPSPEQWLLQIPGI